MTLRSLIPLAALSILGCNRQAQVAEPPEFKKSEPEAWSITNFDPTLETPGLLWNGLIGLRTSPFPAKVNFFDLRAYQTSGEEKILPLANPLAVHWSMEMDGPPLDSKTANDFQERLDFKSGSIVRSWSWETETARIDVEQVVTVHPEKRSASIHWKVNTDRYTIVWLRRPPDPLAKQQANTSQMMVDNITLGDKGYQFGSEVIGDNRRSEPGADDLGTWQPNSAILGIEPGKPLEVDAVLQDNAQPDLATVGPRQAAMQIRRAAGNYWRKAWETDIEIDGPVEDQQFVRSALFYLRSSIHPDGNMSVSPMGLSSDIYGGHVFWDADIWVFPALAFIEPVKAATIPNYRLAKLSRAWQNFNEWVQAGRPTAKQPMGAVEYRGTDFAKFPWESSVSGKETVPGPSRFQEHISGSVAWSVSQAANLGLVDTRKAVDLRKRVANYYGIRSEKGADGKLEIRSTMSPDENHIGDNDLYTNLLAQWATGKPYNIPQDEKSLLTYDNDALRGYKQAAAVLGIYPLQNLTAESQAQVMMDRFAAKVTKNGPAMSDSIHALIWARLGEKDKAYEAWRNSWKPFMKKPFLQFSEKRNASRTYFTTGAAGSLQAVIYGFAGFRIDSKKSPDAKWSTNLNNGQVLSISPHLPNEWKKLTLRNFTILGKRYSFTITNDTVRVTSDSAAHPPFFPEISYDKEGLRQPKSKLDIGASDRF